MSDQDGILNAEREVVGPPADVKAVNAFINNPSDVRLWEAAYESLSTGAAHIDGALAQAIESYSNALAQLGGAAEGDRDRREKAVAEARSTLRGELLKHRPLNIRHEWDKNAGDRLWLVEDRIPAHRYGQITGPGGTGKSRVVLELARAVCQNPDTNPDKPPEWLTWPVQNGDGPVLWCSWEDESDEFKRRLGRDGWIEVHQALHVVDVAEHGPLWGPRLDGSGHTSTLAELTPLGHRIRQKCEELSAKLLVLDPLAGAFASNENDRGLVRSFVSSWDGWARRVQCSLVVIAHPPKDKNVTYAGVTDWQAASRWMAALRPPERGTEKHKGKDYDAPENAERVLEFEKGNYGPTAEGAYLAWIDKGGGFGHIGTRYPRRKGEFDGPLGDQALPVGDRDDPNKETEDERKKRLLGT